MYMHPFRIQVLVFGQAKQRFKNLAAGFRGTRAPGNAKTIAAAGDFDIQATLDLTQMFVKLTAEIGKAIVVGGLEDHVP